MELWIFIAAVHVIHLFLFKKKKHKYAGPYPSKTVKAPHKEWLADINKKQILLSSL